MLGCKLCTVLGETACCLAGALAAQSIRLRQVGSSLTTISLLLFLLLLFSPFASAPSSGSQSKNFAAKSSREDKVYQEGVCLCE